MTTLIRIPTGHMHFVPARKQSDDSATELSPARWPVEFVLISNAAGRDVFLDRSRIRTTLAPAIQATYRMATALTHFFPSAQTPTTETRPLPRPFITRPQSRCPASSALVTLL